LCDQWSGFKQDNIDNVGSVFREFELGGASEVGTTGEGLELAEVICGKFSSSEIKN